MEKKKLMSKAITFIVFIIISLLCSTGFTLAYGEFYKEIKNVSLSLKGETIYSTADKIDFWVERNINYEYKYFPIGIRATWDDRQGDCTDKAFLKKMMLSYVGIESRIAHGYIDGDKHDTIYFNINETYYNFEGIDFVGWGRW